MLCRLKYLRYSSRRSVFPPNLCAANSSFYHSTHCTPTHLCRLNSHICNPNVWCLLQEQEETKRKKFEKELKVLDDFAAAAGGEGEAAGWLCGKAGEGRMTLADVAYLPFIERIDATLEKLKARTLPYSSLALLHMVA